jgi:hypothetical protein
VHHRDPQVRGSAPDRPHYPVLERQTQGIIADPILEEIAEDVEGVRPGGDIAEKAFELRDDARARFVEVEVGDEERARGGPLWGGN